MSTTNPPLTVQAAADRLYAAALHRARIEADDNATGRLTAAGSADLDYAQDQWQEALDGYVEARNAEGGARILRAVSDQISHRVRELRDQFRSGAVSIDYINGMEDADLIVERAIAHHEMAVEETNR